MTVAARTPRAIGQRPTTGSVLAAATVAHLVERYRERVAASGVPVTDRGAVAAVIDRLLSAEALPDRDRDGLLVQLVDEISGAGPIQCLLDDPEVTEVMVNAPDVVFVEVHGRLLRAQVAFRDAGHVEAVVQRLVAASGRRLDDGSPMLDARLDDGTRLNAVLPPIAVDCPQLTLRRPPHRLLGMAELVAAGAVDRRVAAFLHAAVLGRCNIVVSGGAGAGKTTLLGALVGLVPAEHRLVVLEDVLEVRVDHPHAVRQECRPSACDGGRRVALGDLVRNCLRMRPDRIVVGEVRGAEAADMLAAMNTGHEGSLTTLHANSCADAVTRLEWMLGLAWPALDDGALRRMIAGSVDLLVHCERDADGVRRVTEVSALDAGGSAEPVVALFRWEPGRGVRAAGEVPGRCLERMARHGVRFPTRLFAVDAA